MELSSRVRNELDDHARLLGRAFHDDPFFSAIMPHAARRTAQLEWWMRCMLGYGYAYGKVHAHPMPSAAGVSIWLPPVMPMMKTSRVIYPFLIKSLFMLGMAGYLLMLNTSAAWMRLHRQESNEIPDWAMRREPGVSEA